MKLIKTEQQIRAYLPNMITTVKGETPFIDRLATYIDAAEDWVMTTFTSVDTYYTICDYTDDNPMKQATARLIVCEALLRAIPSLDVVLTPNGFAVLSTQNLAPASKPRVDRLLASMLAHRDDAIALLLQLLPTIEKWHTTQQAMFFGATLFPNLSIVDAVGLGSATSKWDRYLELHPQIIDMEASLAEEWFSPELMEKLRQDNALRSGSSEAIKVIRLIKAQIIEYIKNSSFSSRRLADILNIIRYNEEHFPEWHNSETAKLFSPPVFKNDKKATGYFF